MDVCVCVCVCVPRMIMDLCVIWTPLSAIQ